MHPTIAEKQALHALWKEEFSFDDGGFTDDFFKRNFTLENCYVLRENKHIVATLCAYPHTMYLQGKHIPVLFISGVITKKQERHKGYMKKLFQLVFTEHQECALLLLQAYHPNIYTSLNFHMTYYYHRSSIHTQVKMNHTITMIENEQDLKGLSDYFLANYDGYLLRDQAYYKNYVEEAKAQGLLLYGIYVQNELQGFARFDKVENVIEELMYKDDDILQSLLAHAHALRNNVFVHSILPLRKHTSSTHGTLMVRLHNINTLKNILQRDIQTLADVFQYSKKPLYHFGVW